MIPSVEKKFQGPKALTLSPSRLMWVTALFFAGVLAIQSIALIFAVKGGEIWGLVLPYWAMVCWGLLVLRIWVVPELGIGLWAVLGIAPLKLSPKMLGQVVVGFLLVTLTFLAVTFLLSWCGLSPDFSELHQQYREWLGTPATGIVLIIVAVILAPIFEEMFFRGFLLRALLHSSSWKVAVVVSALFFGVLHPIIALPITVTLGICLGLIYFWSADIWTIVMIHLVWNTTAMVLIFWGTW